MAVDIPKSRYKEIAPYQTKDNSTIRELMNPAIYGNRNQSLAEATIPAGTRTLLHRHVQTEEIYHVTHGSGVMLLENQSFPITVGDTICIFPGQAHCVENISGGPLRILCCCAPPYSHEDSELIQ